MRRAGRRGELPFERLDLGTQHEPPAIDHALDRRADRGRLLGEVQIRRTGLAALMRRRRRRVVGR